MKKKKRHLITRIFKWLAFLGLSFILLVIFLLVWAYEYHVPEPPDLSDLKNMTTPSSSLYFPADKRVLGEFYRKEKLILSLDEIPPNLKNAFLACEDSEYFSHRQTSIIKNAYWALSNGCPVMGGNASPINQMVVKEYIISRQLGRNGHYMSEFIAKKMESR